MNQVKNFRELAKGIKNKDGRIIKKKMIFRSGTLSDVDASDIQFLEDLGIKRIYDLRSSTERLKDHYLHDIETIGFDVANSDPNKKMDKEFLEKVAPKAQSFMMTVYMDHLPFSPILKPLMQSIILERDAFLFHCAAGKDRTGVVGALLMSILDFDEESIVTEYVRLDPSVVINVEESHRKQGLSEDVIRALYPMNSVHHHFIEAFLETIKEKYGSMDQYISEFLCLSEDEIKQFKDAYLVSKE